MPPAVSIVMAVKNASPTLPEAIESCLEQDFPDFELIAVDDFSSDDTPAILESYRQRDPRLRVLRPERPGLVEAHRTGCAASRAPYLARMDADDRSLPRRIGLQHQFLESRPDLSAASCLVRITGSLAGEGFQRYEKWLNALLEPEEIARERFIESPVVHPSSMMRRSALESIGGYADPHWAEDYDLWLRFLDRGHHIAKVAEMLFQWRDSPERLTRTNPRYTHERFLAAKAHYMARLEAVRERGVMISGAGPIGKRLAGFLAEEGITIHAFLEVHPRRVGERIDGVPVRSWKDLPFAAPGSPVQIGAVGQPGRRDAIRRIMAEAGYTEGRDFFCAA